MEIIIRDKLVTFLKLNIMMNNSQHGFCTERSCLMNLFDIYNGIFFILLPVAPVGLMETLDGRPPPVSSAD